VDAGATFAVARDRQLGALAARDRRLAYELAAGVLRRRAELDRLLPVASVDPRLRDILRLGAYQLRRLTRVPAYAAVTTSVALAREVGGERAAGYVNRLLRDLARETGNEKRAKPHDSSRGMTRSRGSPCSLPGGMSTSCEAGSRQRGSG